MVYSLGDMTAPPHITHPLERNVAEISNNFVSKGDAIKSGDELQPDASVYNKLSITRTKDLCCIFEQHCLMQSNVTLLKYQNGLCEKVML